MRCFSTCLLIINFNFSIPFTMEDILGLYCRSPIDNANMITRKRTIVWQFSLKIPSYKGCGALLCIIVVFTVRLPYFFLVQDQASFSCLSPSVSTHSSIDGLIIEIWLKAEKREEEYRKTNSFPVGRWSGSRTVRRLNEAYVVRWETLIFVTVMNEKTKYLPQTIGWCKNSIGDKVPYVWS